jgi:hypothetical protein
MIDPSARDNIASAGHRTASRFEGDGNILMAARLMAALDINHPRRSFILAVHTLVQRAIGTAPKRVPPA